MIRRTTSMSLRSVLLGIILMSSSGAIADTIEITCDGESAGSINMKCKLDFPNLVLEGCWNLFEMELEEFHQLKMTRDANLFFWTAKKNPEDVDYQLDIKSGNLSSSSSTYPYVDRENWTCK
jgi:hypothetical protein